MSGFPRHEPPILIEYVHRDDHHHYEGDNSDSTYERRPLNPREVWIQADSIPTTPPPQTPFPGTLSAVVRGISGVVLTQQTVSHFGNSAQFLDMVPATYANNTYKPTLRDSNGVLVPYNPSMWVADGLRSRIEFKYGIPNGVTPPFTIDYWRYVGAFAGAGGGDESTVPADLDLYVSAAGNDTTGTGSPTAPYLTIERALRDVRMFGWNDTAEIRILSTGGPFTWPTDLDVNTGALGAHRTPLVLRGWNSNANPGRTLVFSQAVVSTAVDTPSGILDIVGAGPFTGAQVGQRVRFLTGPLAAYSLFGTFAPSQVDVPVCAVPNATTLRLAWAVTSPAALPNPGDAFVVEALDTVLTVGAVSTVWGGEYLLFEDVVFSSPLAFAGLTVAGGVPLQARAAHIRATGTFLLLGFDSSAVIGGGLSNFDLGGAAPTTKSLFVDTRGGGQLITAIDGGPQNIDASLANAGFVGAGMFNFSGEVSASYFDGVRIAPVTADLRLSFTWLDGESIRPVQGCYVDLRNLRVSGGSVTIGETSTCRFGMLTIAAGGLEVSDASFVSGSGLAFEGLAPGAQVSVLQGGGLVIDDDLTIPVSASDGVVVAGQSALMVIGNLSSMGHTAGSGLVLRDSSRVHVNGAVTLDGNSFNGIVASETSLFACGALSASTNGQAGVLAQDGSRLHAIGNATLDGNGFNGLSADEGSLVLCAAFSASVNGQTGGLLQNGSRLQVSGSAVLGGNSGSGLEVDSRSTVLAGSLTTNSNASSGTLISGSVVSVNGQLVCQSNASGSGLALTDSTAQVGGGIDATLNTGAPQVTLVRSSLQVAGALSDPGPTPSTSVALDASRLMAGALTLSQVGSTTLSVRNGSLVEVSGPLSLTNSTFAGITAFVAEASTIRADSLTMTGNGGIGFLLLNGSRMQTLNACICSTNAGDGFVVGDGSQLTVRIATCNSNGGSGIRLDGGAGLTATGTIDCGANTSNGISISNGSSAEVLGLTSAAGPNGGVGVSARRKSTLLADPGNTMTGAGGDVTVGVNATTTWAAIDTKSPASITDYLSAQPVTELCSVST